MYVSPWFAYISGYSFSISGIINDKGEITHFVAVKEDIT